MAIVIEEQQRKVSITKIAIWAGIIVAIGVVAYYIFFKKPALVDIVIPPAFQNTQALSSITLNPGEVVETYAFQALKQHVEIVDAADLGRDHPFLPFAAAMEYFTKKSR